MKKQAYTIKNWLRLVRYINRKADIGSLVNVDHVCPICKIPIEYLVHIDRNNTICYPCQHTSKEVRKYFNV